MNRIERVLGYKQCYSRCKIKDLKVKDPKFTNTTENTWKKLVDILSPDIARYILYKSTKEEAPTFIVWLPETAPVKQRMIYSLYCGQ